jgi:hypothetical protein
MNERTEAYKICRDLGALSPGRERLIETYLSQANPDAPVLPTKTNPARSHCSKRNVKNVFKSLLITGLVGSVLAACSSLWKLFSN